MRNSLPILDRVPVSSVAKLLKHAFRNRTKELRSEIRVLRSEIDRLREELLNKVTHGSQPNTSKLSLLAKDVDLVKINIKHLGYELCRRELERYGQREQPTPRHVGLICKPATQTDIESDWAAYWRSKLVMPMIYHRKGWEMAYVAQVILDDGHMQAGTRGLVFGAGNEPIPSYLASLGIFVTATDLPAAENTAALWDWDSIDAVERLHYPAIVARDQFKQHVEFRAVDMRDIPTDLTGYDFCWSVCALEHLGSIAAGVDFIENSLTTLRPGGTAIHTTEFNFLDNEQTIDNWPSGVLFQRKHLEQLSARLKASGHQVADLDFDVGHRPLDKFIDLPPYFQDWPVVPAHWDEAQHHIKLTIDGFASTAFGLIIRRGA